MWGKEQILDKGSYFPWSKKKQQQKKKSEFEPTTDFRLEKVHKSSEMLNL